MARSYKHSPFCGITTARSEKQDKRLANRALRSRINTHLASGGDPDLLPVMREVSDVWGMAKDGKQRLDKGAGYYKKLMRK